MQRLKKYPCLVIREVEFKKGRSGYGFTISGQHPSCLSTIAPGSSAEMAGLKAGDLLMAINGEDVSQLSHDMVVRKIGQSSEAIALQIAISVISSDSSSDERSPRSKRTAKSHARLRTVDFKNPASNHRWERQNNYCSEDRYSSNCNDRHRLMFFSDFIDRNSRDDSYTDDFVQNSSCNLDDLRRQTSTPTKIGRRNGHDSGYADDRRFEKTSKHTIITKEARLGIEKPQMQREPTRIDDNSCRFRMLSNNHAQQQYRESVIDRYFEDQFDKDFEVIVWYAGTVAMPKDSSHSKSHFQAMHSAVQRIKASAKGYSLVRMDVSEDGIRLFNVKGQLLVHYLIDCIAFWGLCPEDERFFALVTLQFAPYSATNNDKICGSSSHIFMIDPRLCEHDIHMIYASQFGINCTMNLDSSLCMEFPESANPVITSIEKLYSEKLEQSICQDITNTCDMAQYVPVGFDSQLNMSGMSNFDDSRISFVNEERDDKKWHFEERNSENIKPSSSGNEKQMNYTSDERCVLNLSVIQPALRQQVILNETSDSDLFRNFHSETDKAFEKINSYASKTEDNKRVADNIEDDAMTPVACISLSPFNVGMMIVDPQSSEKESDIAENPHKQSHPHQSSFQTCNKNFRIDDGECNDGESPISSLLPRSIANVNGTDQNTDRLVPASSRTHKMSRSRHPIYIQLQDRNAGQMNPTVSKSSSSKPPLPLKSQDVSSRLKRNPKSMPLIDKIITNAVISATDEVEICKLDSSKDDHNISCKVLKNMKTPPTLLENHESFGNFNLKNSSISGSYESLVAIIGDKSTGDGMKSAASGVTAMLLARSSKEIAQTPAETTSRASSWAVSFDKLLNDKAGIATFTEFLKKEMSEENMNFWLICENYKTLPDDERKMRAVEMYKTYVDTNASDSVNVDGIIRTTIEKSLNTAAFDLFNNAQKHIYQLMKQDTYSRFKKSDLYKEAVLAEMEGRPFPFSGEEKEKTNLTTAITKESKKKKSSKTKDEKTMHEKKHSYLLWKKKTKKLRNPDSEDVKVLNNNRSTTVVEKSEVLDDISIKLTDGSVIIVKAACGQKIGQLLQGISDKVKSGLIFTEAIDPASNNLLDLMKDISVLTSREIHLIPCVIFRLTLPNEKSLVIRGRNTKTVNECLGPIFNKFRFSLDKVVLHIAGTGILLKEEMSLKSLEFSHVLTESIDDFKEKKKRGHHSSIIQRPTRQHSISSSSSSGSFATEALHELFQDFSNGEINLTDLVFDEFGICNIEKICIQDKGHSEVSRSSGLFSFLHRTSVDKSKTNVRNIKLQISSKEDIKITTYQKNHDDERFIDLLASAQCRQLDAQRGVRLSKNDLLLPDFLKEENDLGVKSLENCVDKNDVVSADKKLLGVVQGFEDDGVKCEPGSVADIFIQPIRNSETLENDSFLIGANNDLNRRGRSSSNSSDVVEVQRNKMLMRTRKRSTESERDTQTKSLESQSFESLNCSSQSSTASLQSDVHSKEEAILNHSKKNATLSTDAANISVLSHQNVGDRLALKCVVGSTTALINFKSSYV